MFLSPKRHTKNKSLLGGSLSPHKKVIAAQPSEIIQVGDRQTLSITIGCLESPPYFSSYTLQCNPFFFFIFSLDYFGLSKMSQFKKTSKGTFLSFYVLFCFAFLSWRLHAWSNSLFILETSSTTRTGSSIAYLRPIHSRPLLWSFSWTSTTHDVCAVRIDPIWKCSLKKKYTSHFVFVCLDASKLVFALKVLSVLLGTKTRMHSSLSAVLIRPTRTFSSSCVHGRELFFRFRIENSWQSCVE